jgi:hypothetical protein
MLTKLCCSLAITVIAIVGLACKGGQSIQSDKSIKEERASSSETGPVLVTAMVRREDGTPIAKHSLHLMVIGRSDKGELSQVDELLTVTGDTDENGNLKFEVPRKEITGVKEFTLGLKPPGNYSSTGAIRRANAKEFLTFKADAQTKKIELGDVVILSR